MRISPIRNYNFTSQTSNRKNIAFKSKYSDLVEEIAQKCQYVKDPSDLIYEELNKHYFSWEISGLMTWDVQRRIEELRYEREMREARLRNMDTVLNAKDREIKTEKTTISQLSHEITETQRKNAREKIKMSRIVASFDRVAEVNKQLEGKYVDLFKFEGDKKFPNAIMVSGLKSDGEVDDVLDFLTKSGCKILKIDFAQIPLESVAKEINALASKIKKSGEHSILYIENFDKYTVPTEENMDFISKFKWFLCSCSKRCDTTILVFENNPKRLDENIIGGHRFEKKIDVSNIKEDVPSVFVPKFDGYTFVYDTDEDSQVDLYLWDAGQNPALLWADTTSYDKIKVVLDRLDEVKAQDRFKYTKYLQVPYSSGAFDAGFTVCPFRRTYEGNVILECEI